MLKEIELIENAHYLKNLRFPLKIDKVIQIVVLSGRMSCLVDLKVYSLQAPAMAILLPGQVLESLEYDEEFKTLTMIMSKEFTDSFNLPVSLQERLFIIRPSKPLQALKSPFFQFLTRTTVKFQVPLQPLFEAKPLCY